jgi:murein DD-endopeptidase MepM/ murein hydrolase activator NlpD
MQDKKALKIFWKKALRKYRFVIMTSDSFEEKFSVKLSRLNIFAFGGVVVFFCFFAAILLITSTPLSEYVPGKASSEVQQEFIRFTMKSDSLLRVLEAQDVYLQNIRNIVSGDKLIAPKMIEPTKNPEFEISFEKSIADSLLRVDVESEDKGALQANNKNNNDVLLFFLPINGVITEGFDVEKKHFGIDVVAKEKTRISTVLEGTVIISHWTSETGYVIGIQHKNEYFSLYKHNSVLLKSVGDMVRVGDPIAIVGNSGELSSGPHLHFELWHQGLPVNPENYILF